MEQALVIIIGLVLIGGFVAFMLWKNKKKRAAVMEGGTAACPPTHNKPNVKDLCIPANWGDWTTHQVDRPLGGWVLVETAATSEQRVLIGKFVEAGLRKCIASATRANPTWTKYADPANYGVLMIKKHKSNMDGTPAFSVGGIQTAGTVINIDTMGRNDTGEPMIVLPEPDTWPTSSDDPYWSYLENSARHEAEHAIEYKNDLGAFLKLAQAGDVHPHWPLAGESAARGLVARQASGCLHGLDETGPILNIGPIRRQR